VGSITGLNPVDKSKPPVLCPQNNPETPVPQSIAGMCEYVSVVFVACCVGNGLCEWLITRSEESYRVCACVCVCARARVCVRACAYVSDWGHLETSAMRRSKSDYGSCTTETKFRV
jgi:hypothetical protein